MNPVIIDEEISKGGTSMKKSISAALLCALLLTACASRATYHEDVSPEPSVESCLSEEIAESAESVEPTAESPARTSEIAGSAETPTIITAEVPELTEEANAYEDTRSNPGLEPEAAFEFNGERYFFELPADLAVISEDGSLIEWRSDVHNRYFDSFSELEDVSDNAALNGFESGKWYLAPDGKLLHLRHVTQEEYDSMTGFGENCPPDNEYLLEYEIENIYNALFYAPA